MKTVSCQPTQFQSDPPSLPTAHGFAEGSSSPTKKEDQFFKLPVFDYDGSSYKFKRRFERGESVDLKPLLSTPDRGYLSLYPYPYSPIQREPVSVPMYRLDRIHVLLYAFTSQASMMEAFRCMYALDSELISSGAHRVAFVIILGHLDSSFTSLDYDNFFFSLPFHCFTIPFYDSHSRDYLCDTYGFEFLTLDPSSVVLPFDSYLFSLYGAQSFPFTDDHCSNLELDDCILRILLSPRNPLVSKDYGPTPENRRVPSYHPHCDVNLYDVHPSEVSVTLEALLECNNLLRVDGTKSISTSDPDLADKRVALYLYYNGQFKDVYQQCVDKKYPEFTIVLVPLPFGAGRNRGLKEFCDSMKGRVLADSTASSTWWLFPFSDKICRRLWRVSRSWDSDKLVILPCPGDVGDICAIDLLLEFGINAYPFTRHAFVAAKFNYYRSLKLEELLGVDFIFNWGLQNKNLLLYFDHTTPARALHYPVVTEDYPKIKSEYEATEIVFVPLDDVSSAAQKDWLSKMEWPVLTADKCAHVIELLFTGERHDNGALANLVAFGKDGKLLSRCAFSSLPLSNTSPPLFQDTLRHEILACVENQIDFQPGF